MINYLSPNNPQVDFETALEISVPGKDLETFQPIDLNLKDETHIVLLPRNPYCLFSYWHLESDTIKEFEAYHGKDSWEQSALFLKLINLSHNKEYLIQVDSFTSSWYLKVCDPSSKWIVCLGKMLPELGFVLLAQSNPVTTPAVQPSSSIDPSWIPVEAIWNEIFSQAYLEGFYSGIYSEELIIRKDDH